MGKNRVVLVVEDHPDQRALVERSLRLDGWEVHVSPGPIGVGNMVRACKPAVVLMDLQLPGFLGDRAILLMRRNSDSPHTLFVLYSSADPSQLMVRARLCGAAGWIPKSVVGTALSEKLLALIAQEERRASTG